jgi:hypothetical protein
LKINKIIITKYNENYYLATRQLIFVYNYVIIMLIMDHKYVKYAWNHNAFQRKLIEYNIR